MNTHESEEQLLHTAPPTDYPDAEEVSMVQEEEDAASEVEESNEEQEEKQDSSNELAVEEDEQTDAKEEKESEEDSEEEEVDTENPDSPDSEEEEGAEEESSDSGTHMTFGDSKVAVGHIDGDFYYGSSPSDPSLPFYNSTFDAKDFIDPSDYQDRFIQDRLIFLSCPHKESLKLAAYSLMNQAAFQEGFQFVYAPLSVNNQAIGQYNLYDLIFRKAAKKKKGKKLFVIDFENDDNSLQYLNSLTSSFGIESIVGELEAKGWYVLCLLHSSKLLQILSEIDTKHFLIQEIPFLNMLLGQYIKDASEQKKLEQSLESQMDKDLWDGTLLGYGFYEEILELVKRGKRSLKHQINLRDEFDKQDKFDELNDFLSERRNIQKISSVAGPENPLAPYLIFVAIHFPNISLREFDWLIRIILKINYDIREREHSLSHSAQEEGDSSGMKKRNLVELWKKYPDFWMKKVFLQIESSKGQADYVNFEAPIIQRNAVTYLQKELMFFSLRCFEEIIKSGIWKDPRASKNLKNGVILLACEQARKDPQVYGHALLLKFLFAISKQDFVIEINFPELEKESSFLTEDSSLQMTKKDATNWILVRLLQEMLRYDNLVQEIHQFLRILIRGGESMIALEIIWSLKYSASFKVAFWICQIIQKGEEKSSKKAFYYLTTLTDRSNKHIYGILKEVKTLWPPKPLKYYSPPIASGLRFFVIYLEKLTLRESGELGKWASNFPLFSNWEASPIEIREHADIIAEGLLHKSVPKVFNRSKKEMYDKVAGFLEEWGIILLGLKAADTHPDADKAFWTLMEAFAEKTTHIRTRELLEEAIVERTKMVLDSPQQAPLIHLAALAKKIEQRRSDILLQMSKYLDSLNNPSNQ
ncbi:MAG: hypothetical protein AAF587_14150 [Bacteroidota bacterium]